MTNKQVTAEELVRALRSHDLKLLAFLAESAGWRPHTDADRIWNHLNAAIFCANLITLDQPSPPTDNEIVWRDGAPLPFSEPINGVEQ